MVKLKTDTYQRVKRLAEEQRATMQEVVARGIDALERQEFARTFEEDFEALRDRPEAWREEQQERGAWESTLNDGLDH